MLQNTRFEYQNMRISYGKCSNLTAELKFVVFLEKKAHESLSGESEV